MLMLSEDMGRVWGVLLACFCVYCVSMRCNMPISSVLSGVDLVCAGLRGQCLKRRAGSTPASGTTHGLWGSSNSSSSVIIDTVLLGGAFGAFLF